MNASGLVVLCRPDQWQMAAIVLSCCPPGLFTPLVVIERPPIDENAYRSLYAAYVAVRNRRDALTGTTIASWNASAAQVKRLNKETDDAAFLLTAFRSWWRHQQLVGELLHRRAPHRAILLFDPEPGELDLIEAIPMSRIGSTRTPVLPESTERVHLADDLGALTGNAWRACMRAGDLPVPAAPVDDSPMGWFRALRAALHHGVPLAPDAEPIVDFNDDAAAEAVLVEADADASGLVGVQYAEVRGAKLVLTPTPDTQAVEAAIAAMSGDSSAKLFGAIGKVWRSLTESPDIKQGLQRIESAVNQAVPEEVVAAVGNRALTAFTRALPYGFVRRGKTDWVNKAIGHVAGDPTLIVLTELLAKSADEERIGFTLVFDTGQFKTRETQDVLHSLKTRPAVPILLFGQAAAGLSLDRLSTRLPIELIHFNTHGNQQDIELADGRLPAWKIVARKAFPSRPYIFNNSCLSWVGVGRSFVRTGARGYIGTLWPVNAEQAALFARKVHERTTAEGWTFASAIRDTGVDRHTDRAYVFVGTVDARLATWQQKLSRREAIERQTIQLIDAIDGTREPSSLLNRFFTPLDDALWKEANELMDALDREWPRPNRLRIDIAIARLDLYGRQARARQDIDPARTTEVQAAIHVIAQADISEPEKQQTRATVDALAGRIALYENRTSDAIALLRKSAEIAGPHLAGALTDLSDTLRAMGRAEEALQEANRALDEVKAATGSQDRRTRLHIVGRIGQLQRVLGNREGALQTARVGVALATELDDLRELATFKGDETRALLTLGQVGDAVDAAGIYRDLARRAYGDREDLAATGALVQALLLANRTDEADRYAREGLALAKAIGERRQYSAFLHDRTVIAVQEGRLGDAVNLGLDAANACVASGDFDGCRRTLGTVTQCLSVVQHTGNAPLEPLLRLAMQTERTLRPKVPDNLRAAIDRQLAYQAQQLATLRGAAGPPAGKPPKQR